MWSQAEKVDSEANQTILGDGDDWNYQVLSINLLRGYGFADQQYSSWESYRLSQPIPGYPFWSDYSFYRAPGFPLMLSAAYAIFGEQTLTARHLLFLLAWCIPLLLPFIGSNAAGWPGAIAGGVAGVIYRKVGNDVDGILEGRLLPEVAATFWMVLFALLFTQFERKNRSIYLWLSAIALSGLIYTRSYFLIVLPVFYLYLQLHRRNLKNTVTFAFISILPILIWCAYASLTASQFIVFTTQGQYDFPRFNNMDVITGFGPNHMNQGAWQPGFSYLDNGSITITNQNAPGPGENGWVKGLEFWAANLSKLPLLFYLKLRAGLWYNDGRLYILGIGFVLMGIRFRTKNSNPLLPGVPAQTGYILQTALILLLAIVGNSISFKYILTIWLLIPIIGLVLPNKTSYDSVIQPTNWFVVFLMAYLLVVLLYGGNPRFHNALDPLILVASLSGLFLIPYRSIRANI